MRHGTHTNKGGDLERRQVGREHTTKRPGTKLSDSRASEDFGQRICQLEVSGDTHQLGKPTLVMLTNQHIAQVEMLATVMSTVIA